MINAAGSGSLQKEGVNKNVPYVSEKQREYFNANRAKLEKQGVSVDEWNKSSAGMKLPQRSPKSKKSIGHRLVKGNK